MKDLANRESLARERAERLVKEVEERERKVRHVCV
jgi:hypothetical protein